MATPSTLTTDLPPSHEWKDLLEEILPPQGRWSEEEYLTLTDHRNGTWLTSEVITRRLTYRNTGSSTHKRRPSRSSACAAMLMKKQAPTGAVRPQHRPCRRGFQLPSVRYSTRIDLRACGVHGPRPR